jgi:hypothetical protein
LERSKPGDKVFGADDLLRAALQVLDVGGASRARGSEKIHEEMVAAPMVRV